ncbi:hypothetical protein [Nocardioides sp.]|uniref:hypothetical protein n=1 Tax=Nocardioides sp. TaxID=35761 RepID=UPI0027365691|nr:hypothetical protein [Nocardioides sp.]MDP3893385.1 hypothetical protein [Nocardioides sp.]
MFPEHQQSTSPETLDQVRAEMQAQLQVERSRSRRRLGVVAGGLAVMMLSLNMGPVVASHLNVRTNDIANKAVTTKKLANGAVAPKKIKNNAVTNAKLSNGAVSNPKIADRAVTSTKLARFVPGMAVAGVDADNFGGATTIHNWFNRFGGQPNVIRTGVGAYTITFPGLEGRLGPSAIVQVTPKGNVGHARQFFGGTTNEVIIRTYNAAGAAADMTFNLTVTAPNQASSVTARPLKGGQVKNQDVENN